MVISMLAMIVVALVKTFVLFVLFVYLIARFLAVYAIDNGKAHARFVLPDGDGSDEKVKSMFCCQNHRELLNLLSFSKGFQIRVGDSERQCSAYWQLRQRVVD